jgi:hypothetical protein
MQRTQPWFIGAALRAIAHHVTSTKTTFTARDVASWDEALTGQPGKARMAFDVMTRHGMLLKAECPESSIAKVEPRYALTAKGLGTCRSVQHAKADRLPNPDALSNRLWSLLRSRRTITSDEAASTLIDAGSRDYRKAQSQIGGYLRAWSRLVPDTVQISAKRVDGCIRYVLVSDGGVHPPPTKANAIAPQAAPKSHPAPHTKEAAQ